jgi:hypothetical protein
VPPEEDAASGKSRWQDGVSAPTYRGFLFAPERGVMPIKIGEFNYAEDVLDASTTAKEYRKAHREAAVQIASETDPERRNALAYGNWMRTRRSGSFEHYEIVQRDELHEVAYILNERLVCTCGLITDVGMALDDREETDFWNAPGHLHTDSRALVSIFIVKVYVSKRIGLQNHYWCQQCGDIGNTIPTKAGQISRLGLKAIRVAHKCEQGEGN